MAGPPSTELELLRLLCATYALRRSQAGRLEALAASARYDDLARVAAAQGLLALASFRGAPVRPDPPSSRAWRASTGRPVRGIGEPAAAWSAAAV